MQWFSGWGVVKNYPHLAPSPQTLIPLSWDGAQAWVFLHGSPGKFTISYIPWEYCILVEINLTRKSITGVEMCLLVHN